MSNESISLHFSWSYGQKSDVGQACRHLWKISSACSRGSPITFSSFSRATKSLQARVDHLIAQPLWWPSPSPRWLHPSLPCFLAPGMSPPPPRETGSPRGAVTSEKVFQVCQRLVQSKVPKFLEAPRFCLCAEGRLLGGSGRILRAVIHTPRPVLSFTRRC